MNTEEALLSRIEERARKATQEEIASQISLAIQQHDASRKLEEFAEMQRSAKELYSGTPAESRAEEFSKLEYSDSNYHLIKGFMEAEKYIPKRTTVTSGSIQKPIGFDAGGIGVSQNAQKRLPVDITELVDWAGGDIYNVQNIAQPSGKMHDGCDLYQTQPNIDFKRLFDHNKVKIMASDYTSTETGLRVVEDLKSSIDKSIERDLYNGYLDAIQII
ncbi:MAG: hypothetical protein ACRCX2_22305 [Paraclostridium sp.]